MDLRRRNGRRERITGNAAQATVAGIAANWRLLLLWGLFSFGMVLGASLIKNTDNTMVVRILDLLERYRILRESQSILECFGNAFLGSFLLSAVAYLCGLCAIGTPVIAAIPLIKGLGTGLLSGYFYANFALRGLGYSALLILPGALLSAFGILLCCNESIRQSGTMYRMAAKRETTDDDGDLRLYHIRFLILLLLCVLAAVLDAVLNRAFVRFFVF